MAANLTAVAVALIGAAAGLIGLYFSRKGQKRSEDTQRVAEVFEAQQALFRNAIDERDYAVRAREEDRASFDRMIAGMQSALEECRDEGRRLAQDLIDLRKVVAGQIARAAAYTASDSDDEAEIEDIRRFIATMKEIGET